MGPVIAILSMWLLWVCLVLGFWGGVIYVALHFISKYW